MRRRVAMRTCSGAACEAPTYLLGDHLGSTSLTTDAAGAKTSEMRYSPWGEVRYTWTKDMTPGLPSRYTFTGQYSYMDDPTTTAAEGFGLMFYNARWYDVQLGRFAQADTIIPQQTQGTQAWDRYAYVNNNPLRYTDPSGHCIDAVKAFNCLITATVVLIMQVESLASRGHGLTDEEFGAIADVLYPASHAGTQAGVQMVAAAGEHGVIGSFELVTTQDGGIEVFSSGSSTLPDTINPDVPDEMMMVPQASLGLFKGPIDGEQFKTTSDFSGHSVAGSASGTIILPALSGDVWHSVNLDSKGNISSLNDVHGSTYGISVGIGPVVTAGVAMMYSEPMNLPAVSPSGWSKLVCRTFEMCGR